MSRRRPAVSSAHPFLRRLVAGVVWGGFSLLMLWIFLSVTLGVMGAG